MKKTAKPLFIGILILVTLAAFGLGLFLVLSGRLRVFLTDRYVAQTEKYLASYRQFDLYIHGLEFQLDAPAHVTVYDEGGVVKKFFARFNPDVEPEESGNRIEREYYYDRGNLVYVYERVNPTSPIGTDGGEESRFYFNNGRMSAWLFGPTKEKKPRDTQYEWQEADLLEISKDLLIAGEARLSWVKREPVPLAKFLPGKEFYYSCEAGERGTLKEDGTFPSYIPGEEKTTRKVGSWRVDGETVIVSGSNIADGVYNDFTFEQQQGTVLAYHNPACGVIISDHVQYIDDFERADTFYFSVGD